MENIRVTILEILILPLKQKNVWECVGSMRCTVDIGSYQ